VTRAVPAPLLTSSEAAALDAHARRLLDVAAGARHPDGGYAWLRDDGTVDPVRARELWITCRMTHVHALGVLLDHPGSTALADHGVAALRGVFRDEAHGGWHARVGPDGAVPGAKTAYEHAFVVLAASSAVAADRPGAADLLEEALAVLLERFVAPAGPGAGLVAEEWDQRFEVLDDYRGLNATMHAVEALLAAADVLDDPGPRAVAAGIVDHVLGRLAPAHDWLLPEHFDPAGRPLLDYHHDRPADPFRPYGATIGHGFEWARLALQLHAATGDTAPGWWVDHAVALADAAARHGWAPDGHDGFVYTVDWDGAPVVRERMHWVAAEAVAAAAALHQATGDPRHADRYRAWWAHAGEWFVDPVRGSWVHERSPDGGASSLTWSGRPDVYHALQAALLPRLPLSPSLATALRDGLLPPPGTHPTP
jgi:sulfoquinovose isomerase